MNKRNFFFLILLFLLVNCQQNEIVRTHGISYLENREKLIILNKSNKNDVIKMFGQPGTKGMTNNNLWIYIERTQTRGKVLRLGRNYLKKNNVLVLEFNNKGIVAKKKFFNKEKMKDVKFSKGITENELKKENFIYSFLSSIRQKMQIRRK